MMNHVISSVTLLSYILFYTAYSKEKKTLDFSLLTVVFAVKKGWDHTFVELNKAISLAGMTVFGLALLLPDVSGLLLDAMIMLSIHSVYSTFKYYGGKNIPLLSTWGNVFTELKSNSKKERAEGVKKVSVVLGSLGQSGLWIGYFEYVSPVAVVLAVGLLLGVSHFYTMEIDFKGVLQVRPYAMVAFPVCLGAAAYALAFGNDGVEA